MQPDKTNMKLSAKIYSYIIAVFGTLFAIYISFNYIFISGVLKDQWVIMLTISIMLILFRSFPLNIDANIFLDLSFLCFLTAMLVYGKEATITMMLICFPIVFNFNYKKDDSHCLTILNTSPIKTFFNLGNHVFSIYVGGLAFELAGGKTGDISFPNIILPLVSFIFVVMILNSIILFVLLSLDGQISFFKAFRLNFIDMISSWIATAPIGYFFAMILMMPSGVYLSVLFFIPLGLARYAFKLYIDSRSQFFNLIKTLTAAIEAKDEYTKGHSMRVSQYAELLGKAMHISTKQIEILVNAAVLHDIGKIGIKDGVLNKSSRLTDDEWGEIKKHPQTAVNILKNASISEDILEIILHHHERYDGKGYPPDTTNHPVSICAYILSVADTFDAITSDRPYRKGQEAKAAINIILDESGKQFHPDVVKALIRIEDDILNLESDIYNNNSEVV